MPGTKMIIAGFITAGSLIAATATYYTMAQPSAEQAPTLSAFNAVARDVAVPRILSSALSPEMSAQMDRKIAELRNPTKIFETEDIDQKAAAILKLCGADLVPDLLKDVQDRVEAAKKDAHLNAAQREIEFLTKTHSYEGEVGELTSDHAEKIYQHFRLADGGAISEEHSRLVDETVQKVHDLNSPEQQLARFRTKESFANAEEIEKDIAAIEGSCRAIRDRNSCDEFMAAAEMPRKKAFGILAGDEVGRFEARKRAYDSSEAIQAEAGRIQNHIARAEETRAAGLKQSLGMAVAHNYRLLWKNELGDFARTGIAYDGAKIKETVDTISQHRNLARTYAGEAGIDVARLFRHDGFRVRVLMAVICNLRLRAPSHS